MVFVPSSADGQVAKFIVHVIISLAGVRNTHAYSYTLMFYVQIYDVSVRRCRLVGVVRKMTTLFSGTAARDSPPQIVNCKLQIVDESRCERKTTKGEADTRLNGRLACCMRREKEIRSLH